jgi:hypothetical protein
MFATAVYDATPKLHLNIAKPVMRCTSSLSLRSRHRLIQLLGTFGLAPLGVTWQALGSYTAEAGRFGQFLDTDMIAKTNALIAKAWATYVSGLLVHCFVKCGDNGTTRDKVIRYLEILSENGFEDKALPVGLGTRSLAPCSARARFPVLRVCIYSVACLVQHI